jgi:hemerythrin-like domain-containing protein
MRALLILEDEHRTFAALLHGLLYLVRDTREHGAPPRLDVLGAIVYFLDTFAERVHHPRESEYLFRLLRRRCPSATPILDRLEEDHRRGDASMRALEQALMRCRHGDPSEFGPFAAAAEAYAESQQQHMRSEELEVLPLAREHLTPDDWGVIDEAFSGNAVPRFAAAATDGYRALFSRIVAIAPPPIGVGPP